MGFNNAAESKKFKEDWRRIRKEYQASGMSESAIQEMYEFDWQCFLSDRRFKEHTQPLPKEVIDEDDERSSLFLKFESMSEMFPYDKISGRYGWIEALADERLAAKMRSLSAEDLELLTLIAVYAYTQAEIAAILGISQRGACKRIQRLQKFFQ